MDSPIGAQGVFVRKNGFPLSDLEASGTWLRPGIVATCRLIGWLGSYQARRDRRAVRADGRPGGKGPNVTSSFVLRMVEAKEASGACSAKVRELYVHRHRCTSRSDCCWPYHSIALALSARNVLNSLLGSSSVNGFIS